VRSDGEQDLHQRGVGSSSHQRDTYFPAHGQAPTRLWPDFYRPIYEDVLVFRAPNTTTDVPWPGSRYIIVEKSTHKAMCLLSQSNKVILQHVDWRRPHHRHRPYVLTCIEGDGWFGFFEEVSRAYIGYDETGTMRPSNDFKRSECFSTRVHPSGSYQLLMPTNGPSLAILVASPESGELAARLFGDTLWQFVKV
jgi:hypothetical protein